MSEFIAYLPEVFELFGTIQIRKMFGGYGVYHDGLMFALVADETLYLKADAENAKFFEEQGLAQFAYQREGKMAKMSYYQAPAEFMEDREQAELWARRSYDAARRAQGNQRKAKAPTAKNMNRKK
ncbi:MULTISPECIES: TfoX/Sxy family protein [Methylomonas]|uniref:Transcriptional regulator n=2 Tax=Methylomonas TaxID=416 RepID=A0A140E5T7_9GAMM|nr:MULTISPECIES: TfoX/Sxy family protein [Methylomonas]AMK78761.1 transcriptional regulator [Methylomonas denitrificans]OAI08414.1 transcriptional regulator [Methylomonas methanica]TCV83483.1 DNA transformation protein [Methylomonas methanica]